MMRIAIVGSGFAGSILARILAIQGHRVLLLDRQRHPRFALGESSTPLAAICLERLAARYGLDDLHALAAWGRWKERLPHLRRGLKRGFTFYGHQPGRPYANGPANERRLLVAASPHPRPPPRGAGEPHGRHRRHPLAARGRGPPPRPPGRGGGGGGPGRGG